VRHVAAHSPVCIPPIKSLPSVTRSPLFSLSAVCLHAWVAPLTCALCSVGTCTICTFTRVSIAIPPGSHFPNRRAGGPAPRYLPVSAPLLAFQRHEHPTVPSWPVWVAPPSCPECRCEGRGGICSPYSQVKTTIRPGCSSRASLRHRWHSHSWLCSAQRATEAVTKIPTDFREDQLRGAKTAFLVLAAMLAASNVGYAQQFRLPNAGQLERARHTQPIAPSRPNKPPKSSSTRIGFLWENWVVVMNVGLSA
jgi:hypothetical protein